MIGRTGPSDAEVLERIEAAFGAPLDGAYRRLAAAIVRAFLSYSEVPAAPAPPESPRAE